MDTLIEIYSLPPLIIAILFIAMGAFIFLENKSSKLNRLFFLTCFATAWWQFSWFMLFNVTNPAIAQVLTVIGYVGIIFIPVLFFHFILLFLFKTIEVRKLDTFLLLSSYALSIFFATILVFTNYFVDGFYEYYWGYYPKANIAHLFYLLMATILSVRIIFLFIKSFHSKEIRKEKDLIQVNRYMLAGVVFYILSSVDFLSNYGLELYPIGVIFIAIFLFIIGHSIIKYNILKIKISAIRIFVVVLNIVILSNLLSPDSKFELVLGIIFFFIVAFFSYLIVKSAEREHAAQKELQLEKERLEGLLKIKADFLRVIHHQLNTPLSVINGAFAMIDEQLYDLRKGQGMIKNGFIRLQETVNDFWSAYELEGEDINMEKGKIPLIRILQRQIKEKRAFISMKGEKTTITLEEPDFEVPAVYCDPQNVEHAISNLLDNAVYYAPDGTITVSIEKEGKDHLKVYIKDTGVGIDPKDQKRIFEKFVRGDRGKRQMPDGSGLGLYIAKKIMEANDGDVQLEETIPDKGTTFSLTVPIFDPEKAPEERPEGARRQHSPVSSYHKIPDPDDDYTILLVEDETGVSKIYSDYLTSIGFTCRVADNTTDGMKIVENEKIDAVLLDIVVPENPTGSINTRTEEGYTFLEWIKGHEMLKDVPVIVFTNLNSDEDRNKAFELGANGYIFKAYAKPQHVVKELLRSVAKL